jgi:hypothetical protein
LPALISEFVGYQREACTEMLGWYCFCDSLPLAVDLISSGRDAIGSEMMLRVPDNRDAHFLHLS